ncbi:response regulator [Spirosoma pulveris]
MMKNKTPLIYMVDDDEHQLDLVKHVFGRYHADCRFRCFRDGSDLIIQLTHRLDRQLPNLIILDWSMPILSGKHILELLKIDQEWRNIPVVVLSASELEEHRTLSYKLGSKAFIAKGETLQELTDTIALIRELWLD